MATAPAPNTPAPVPAPGDSPGGYTVTLPPPGPTGAVSPQTVANLNYSRQLKGEHWSDQLFIKYLGKLPTDFEVNQLNREGWTPERLENHLKAQPSYVHGVNIGQLYDFHANAEPHFQKWLGRSATDADVTEFYAHGARTPEEIEKYLTNRADVVSRHPGAPLGLGDQEYGKHKAAIDSQYQANLGRSSTDQEARTAYAQQASPFRRQPAEQ